MENCSCVYVDYDSGPPEFHRAKIQTAKKEQRCGECKRIIRPFEKYEYVSGKWDNCFDTHKTCMDCIDIRNIFFCDGWLYGGMKEYLQEHLGNMHGETDEDCLVTLTPGARAFICEMIEEIWEDYDD